MRETFFMLILLNFVEQDAHAHDACQGHHAEYGMSYETLMT